MASASDKGEFGAASAIAGGQLAELLALALIEKGVLDREQMAIELELLADARMDSYGSDQIAGQLIHLANSLRAGKVDL